MKHQKLFNKLLAFCLVAVASLIGANFSQTNEQILIFTFTTGISMGASAVYLTEIIKRTEI